MHYFTRECILLILDKYLDDGLDRESFIKAVHHVIEKRFGWPGYIADVAVQLYTNSTRIDDVYANRENYVKVTLSNLVTKLIGYV